MARLPEIPKVDLQELNDSELTELCQWLGIRASRGWPRWLLVQSLEQFVDYEVPDRVDERRSKVSTWLQRYWKKAQMQARKKVCPHCTYCRDLRALECYDVNRKNIEGR